MHPALGLLLAYLAGSIPAAYLAGRAHGIDLRQHGSGNLGTTNVFRVLGWKMGVLVFAVDVAKGALPVVLLPGLLAAAPVNPDAVVDPRLQLWAIAFGVAAVIGHVKPVFLLGRGGGKGVATATGVFVALAPAAIAAMIVLFAAIVAVTGIVSLGSIVGATLLPLAIWLTQGASPVFWVSLPLGAFVVWTHRSNIRRLARGEEPSFRRRRQAGDAGATEPTRPAGAPPAGGA